MISVIIPSYRAPKYLDLCLHSLLTEQVNKNEVIVIVDGFIEESQWVVDKYKDRVGFLLFPENRGMQSALNFGVYNATNDKCLIVNDDNVFPHQWDKILGKYDVTDTIVTPNQIEPDGPGMFNFPVKDFGKSEDSFRYDDFIKWEQSIRKDEDTPDGEIFPFMI